MNTIQIQIPGPRPT